MIAVIDYNSGNVRSVANALDRLGYDCIVTHDLEVIRKADKVIFPGVGEASSAMKKLKERGLDELIKTLEQPVLGICLGLQLMCIHSEEGNTEGLGIFNTSVHKFTNELKVPHMGWNNFSRLSHSLFTGVETKDDMYFVHSYYAKPCDEAIAVVDYGVPFAAALQKDNFYAVQFHPEKSGAVGAKIIQNFLEL